MITESRYWKEPLLKGAATITKLMNRETLSEAQFARVERELFIGFYAVRKLLESTAKVTKGTATMKLTLKWYPKLGSAPLVDWYNRSEFWELYDLDVERSDARDILYVAHQMVVPKLSHPIIIEADKGVLKALRLAAVRVRVHEPVRQTDRRLSWEVDS